MSPAPFDGAAPAAAHVGGHGPALVLLHGLGGTWEAWQPLIPALEARHRVIALTLPGHDGGPDYRGKGEATVAGLQLVAMRARPGFARC